MLEYILTPGGKGIMRNRDGMVVKRRLCISIPQGATLYVNGKECKSDGAEAWISASALQHINTVRITKGKETWCCEGFSYVDGMVKAQGFDIHECMVRLLENYQKMSKRVEQLDEYVEGQKQAQQVPLFF